MVGLDNAGKTCTAKTIVGEVSPVVAVSRVFQFEIILTSFQSKSREFNGFPNEKNLNIDQTPESGERGANGWLLQGRTQVKCQSLKYIFQTNEAGEIPRIMCQYVNACASILTRRSGTKAFM